MYVRAPCLKRQSPAHRRLRACFLMLLYGMSYVAETSASPSAEVANGHGRGSVKDSTTAMTPNASRPPLAKRRRGKAKTDHADTTTPSASHGPRTNHNGTTSFSPYSFASASGDLSPNPQDASDPRPTGDGSVVGSRLEFGPREHVLWTVGWDQFMREQRHACCVELALQRMEAAAGAVVAAMLDLSMPTELSVNQVYRPGMLVDKSSYLL